MKKVLAAFLAILFAACNTAVAEEFKIVWLWDIPLTDPAENTIACFERLMDISFEKKEYSSGSLYETKDKYHGVNIQGIPFGVYISTFTPSDEQAESFGWAKARTIAGQLRLSHKSVCESAIEESVFLQSGETNLKTLYAMLVQKLGIPSGSYCQVTNGAIFGTKPVLDTEWPNQEKFICPPIDNIDVELYKQSQATYVSFHYSWGHVVLTAGFSLDDSAQVTFEIKEGPAGLLFADDDVKGDYFKYAEEEAIGLTSF